MARRGRQQQTGNAAALERVKARVQGLSEAKVRQATQRAMAGVRRRFEPEAKRTVRETYNVKLGALSQRFRTVSGRDGKGEFLALQASTQRTDLMDFGARWRGKARIGGQYTPGASAQIRKGGARTYASAFIATLRSRKRVLARQLTPGGKRDPRNKLRVLRGPSAFQMVQGLGEANARQISERVRSFLIPEMRRQLELARRSKR